MNNRYLIVPILLVLNGCAVNGEWSRQDTILEVGFQVVNAMDAYSTANIKDVPNVYLNDGTGRYLDRVEGNPFTRAFIGREPTDRDTALYFTTLGLSHWAISRALPPKWRPWYQGGTTAFHLHAVIGNCKGGLC